MTEETIKNTLTETRKQVLSAESHYEIAAKQLIEQHEAEMVEFIEWVNETYTLFMEYPKQTYVNRVDANRNPFGANLLPRYTTTELLTLFKNRNK